MARDPEVEAGFRSRLEKMMADSRDPELHSAIWDYREGKLDRRGLASHPAYTAAMRTSWAEARSRLESRGMTPERIAVAVRDAVEADPDVASDDVLADSTERPVRD